MVKTPTPEVIREYINKFHAEHGKSEKRLNLLFYNKEENTNEDDVFSKICAIDDIYHTHLDPEHMSDITDVIVDSDIDEELPKGDKRLVDGLADAIASKTKKRQLSFASKYCSFHHPDIYPIYDSKAKKLVATYLKDKGHEINAKDFEQKYSLFIEKLDLFIEEYGLQEFSYKEIDIFLWMYQTELDKK